MKQIIEIYNLELQVFCIIIFCLLYLKKWNKIKIFEEPKTLNGHHTLEAVLQLVQGAKKKKLLCNRWLHHTKNHN